MPVRLLARTDEGDPCVLHEHDVRRVIGETTPVAGTCHCARAFQPLHVVNETMAMVREALELLRQQTGRVLPADAVAATYRCGRCKGVAQLTARHLGMAEAS